MTASRARSGRKVVITGLGVVSPVGTGRQAFWDALVAGRCGFARVRSFDAAGWRTDVAAEVKDFEPRRAFDYALACAREALAEAGLPARGACGTPLEPERSGVALGTTSGEAVALEELMAVRFSGDRRAFDDGLAAVLPGNVPARVAAALGLAGPNVMHTSACAAGNFALAWAYERIADGRAQVMLAGGVDVFSMRTYAGFNRLLAVAPKVCAPFSKGRLGLIPAEGCAVLVLEDAEHAAGRGARPYAEVLGYGLSSDAFHATMPDSEGIARALRGCLDAAGLRPEDVDYVNAHGTGTLANDKAETAAIKAALGERARSVPVSSIKSMLGHAMGAASALEAAASCLALRTGVLPPTMNFAPGDPECDLDYVPNASRKTDPKVVISSASAFGGANAAVAFGVPGRKPVSASRARPARRVAVTGLASVAREEPEALLDRVGIEADRRFLNAPIAYALAASKLALADARLGSADEAGRGGVILDSTGEVETQYEFFSALAREGPAGVEPFQFPTMLANAAVSRCAIVLGLKAVSKSLSGGFPAGESAVCDAADALARMPGSFIVAGGVDDGAGVLVLEDADAAKARGARIYAELLGRDESFDASKKGSPRAGCRGLTEALKGFFEGSSDLLEHVAEGRFGSRVRLRFCRARLAQLE